MAPAALLLITLFINGNPSESQIRLDAMTTDCRTELAILQGINQTYAGSGINFQAVCMPNND